MLCKDNNDMVHIKKLFDYIDDSKYLEFKKRLILYFLQGNETKKVELLRLSKDAMQVSKTKDGTSLIGTHNIFIDEDDMVRIVFEGIPNE